MFYLRYIINGVNGTKNYQLEAFPVLRNKKINYDVFNYNSQIGEFVTHG